MKDLIMLTDKPIQPSDCSILKDVFHNLIVLNDDETTLYMKKSGKGFELWFTPLDQLDDPDCMMEDTVDRCPNKKAYLTNLAYTSKHFAKGVVEALAPLFGNMWVQSDEEDDWFGTAEDFINVFCKEG